MKDSEHRLEAVLPNVIQIAQKTTLFHVVLAKKNTRVDDCPQNNHHLCICVKSSVHYAVFNRKVYASLFSIKYSESLTLLIPHPLGLNLR